MIVNINESKGFNITLNIEYKHLSKIRIFYSKHVLN